MGRIRPERRTERISDEESRDADEESRHVDEESRDVSVDDPPTGPRLPPFEPNESLVDHQLTFSEKDADIVDSSRTSDEVQARLSWTAPAFYVQDYSDARSELFIVDKDNLQKYLQSDLRMGWLGKLEKYLWLASVGETWFALHQYFFHGYSILLTEKHWEHQVEKGQTVFVKPLPEYLLSHSVWDSYLCKDDDLYAEAIGMLRSYLLLIRTKIDMNIAQENSLVPKELTWQQWASFSRAAMPNCHLESCNPRYWYGPLDETRLTWIWRLSPETFRHSGWSRYISYTYNTSSFIQENTKWLFGTLIYVTIVLTAMQVGLATDRLGSNDTFTRASSGFTIFSILAPLAVLLGVIIVAVLQLSRFLVGRFKGLYGNRARPYAAEI
ncbi:MAG: hypothetical protein Q9195_006128 [Heterodermia aff. obscurata]